MFEVLSRVFLMCAHPEGKYSIRRYWKQGVNPEHQILDKQESSSEKQNRMQCVDLIADQWC